MSDKLKQNSFSQWISLYANPKLKLEISNKYLCDMMFLHSVTWSTRKGQIC